MINSYLKIIEFFVEILEEIRDGKTDKLNSKLKTIQSNETYGLYYAMLSSQLKLEENKQVLSAFTDKEEELNFYK